MKTNEKQNFVALLNSLDSIYESKSENYKKVSINKFLMSILFRTDYTSLDITKLKVIYKAPYKIEK